MEARQAAKGTGIRSLLLARLFNRGAARWYIGGGFALLYQSIIVVQIITAQGSVGGHLAAIGLLTVLYLAFLAIPPLFWNSITAVKITVTLAYWAATCLLLPVIGVVTVWVWVLVAAIACFISLPLRYGVTIIVAITIASLYVAAANGFNDAVGFAPVITVSVGISLLASSRQIESNRRLRRANDEIARLAVADERARLARDLHDILGHSLTVVTVKSELASRLVTRDPQKAIAEIKDIESLAREALADLRATVSSYREASLASELASARTALAAANIEAHVPVDVAEVDPELRAVFGWVVREGVTNVIRHSRAKACWIELGRDSITITDDGIGVSGSSDASSGRDAQRSDVEPGNGLRGLGERTHAAGLRLTTGARPHGGFTLMIGRCTE